MTPRLIVALLTIAKEANNWPQTRHLRDEALRELSEAHVSTVDHIIPVMIVKDDEAEAEPPHREAQSPSTRMPRGMT
jgi:hypothetical protein